MCSLPQITASQSISSRELKRSGCMYTQSLNLAATHPDREDDLGFALVRSPNGNDTHEQDCPKASVVTMAAASGLEYAPTLLLLLQLLQAGRLSSQAGDGVGWRMLAAKSETEATAAALASLSSSSCGALLLSLP